MHINVQKYQFGVKILGTMYVTFLFLLSIFVWNRSLCHPSELNNKLSNWITDFFQVWQGNIAEMFLNIHQFDFDCTVKPVLSGHSKRPKIGCQYRLLLSEGQKYCRMLQESILQYF